MDKNSVFVMLNIINECSAILINCPNCLFGTKVNNIFDACWWLLFTKLQCTKTTSADSTSSPSLSSSTSFFVLLNSFKITILVCTCSYFENNTVFDFIRVSL